MWTYHNPVRVIAGNGSLNQLPALLAGRNCLLVTFPEAGSLGLVQRIRQLIGEQLRGVIDSILPNPDVQWLGQDRERRRYLIHWAVWDSGVNLPVVYLLELEDSGRRPLPEDAYRWPGLQQKLLAQKLSVSTIWPQKSRLVI